MRQRGNGQPGRDGKYAARLPKPAADDAHVSSCSVDAQNIPPECILRDTFGVSNRAWWGGLNAGIPPRIPAVE
jgi:hypothetical protein